MDMEGLGTEEFVGSSNNVSDATHIAKGKRTKRLRLLSPCGVAASAATVMMTSSCSSASGDHVSGGGDYGSFSSTTTTYESTDQEEEDMVNCLILLSQGGGGGGGGDVLHRRHHKQQAEDHDHAGGNNIKTEKGSTSSRRFAEMPTVTATPTGTATASKIGFYIYECKTCNRTFPSFQALGGHRASHKKPKVTVEEKKTPAAPPPPPPPPPQPQLMITNYDHFEEAGQPQFKSGPPISLQLGSHRAFLGNKAKIHECSICGSEFTSGQALGGHMRRHRASTNTSTQVVGIISGIEMSCNTKAATPATAAVAVEVQPRNILQLDLNLPAPEDDLQDSKFQFTATQKSMVLSAAPALVDCHY